jgi:hypothetical protein
MSRFLCVTLAILLGIGATTIVSSAQARCYYGPTGHQHNYC